MSIPNDLYLRFTSTPPIRVHQIGDEVNFSFDPTGEITVRLTDVSSSGGTGSPKYYSWKQVLANGTGGWFDAVPEQAGGWDASGGGAPTGAGPAFELNNKDVHTGDTDGEIVKIYPGAWDNVDHQTWLFASPGDSNPTPSDSGNCFGCGWLLEGDIPCLKFTIAGIHGHCLCIDNQQIFKLFYDTANDRYLGGPLKTCCGCTAIEFKIVKDPTYHQIFGTMRMVKRNHQCDDDDGEYTQTQYILWNFRCCGLSPDGNPTAQADAANTRPALDNCDGGIGGCDNSFTVKIECITDCDNRCCCGGCASLFNCQNLKIPPAYYIDLSGFTGNGLPLNILWVLTPDTLGSCVYKSICIDPPVTITLEWIGTGPYGVGAGGIGFRLTLDVGTGTAIYETDNVIQLCYSGFTVTKVSSDIGGPSTIDVKALGMNLSDGKLDPVTECCDLFPPTLHAVVTNTAGGCSCLDGKTLTLTRVDTPIEGGCGGVEYSSGDYVSNGCSGESGNTIRIRFGCNLGEIPVLQVEVTSFGSESGFIGTIDQTQSTCSPLHFVCHCTSVTNGVCGAGIGSDGTFDVVITL